jgi:hypothetical protein
MSAQLAEACRLLDQLAAQVRRRSDVLAWAAEVYGSPTAAAGCLGVTGAGDDAMAEVVDRLLPAYAELVEAHRAGPVWAEALRPLARHGRPS